MASKMKKKEIDDFIKSKSITQETYKAPTVKVHVDNKAPAMAAAAQQQRQKSFINPIQTIDVISDYKQAQNNLKKAETTLDLKSQARQQKQSDIYKKAGQEFTPKFENLQNKRLDYQNKQTEPISAIPERKISESDVKKQLQNELAEENEALRKYKIAEYQKNVAKVNQENSSVWDKSLGNIVTATMDMANTLNSGGNKVVDDQGNEVFLPSYWSLKHQKVSQDYGDNLVGKLAKAGGDILYGGTQLLESSALNATGVPLGSALYWANMATNSYQDTKNQGYSDERTMLKTAVDTGLQFGLSKVLGGATAKAAGGKFFSKESAGALEKALSKQMGKVISNPTAQRVLASSTTEGIEEMAEDWAQLLTDRITINKKITAEDAWDTFKQSLYDAGIGFGTGGFVEGSLGRNQNTKIDPVQMQIVQNTNPVQRDALVELTQKRKKGIPFDDNDYAIIAAIKNDVVNNSVDMKRTQDFGNNLQINPIEAGLAQPTVNTQQTQPVQETKLPHSSRINEVGYHASNQTFDDYDTSKIGTGQGDNTQGKGINLASVKEAVDGVYGKNTYETNINLENAYTVDDKKLLSTFEKDFGYKTDMDNISDELQKKGYDGIVINVNGNKLYTVFDKKNLEIKNNKNAEKTNKLTSDEINELKVLKDLPFEDEESGKRIDELLIKQDESLKNQMSPVRDLNEVRNYEDMGSKKINAYQYDNPEVKPYFETVADDMLKELDNATKGEKFVTEDGTWKGQQRVISDDLAELLDGENGTKYSYEDIRKGLKAIIEDAGAENKAVSKRIEFYIDQRLRNGYKDYLGYDVPKNTKYLDTLRDKMYEGIDAKKSEETKELDNSSVINENIAATKEDNKITQKTNQQSNTIKEIKKEVEKKTNKTMSKHIETSSEATGTVEDIKNMDYDSIVYDTKSHEQSKEQALRELEGKDTDTNVNDIHAKFRGTERLTNVDSAKITELMKQTKALADEAAKSGNDSEYNKRMEQFRTLKGDYAVALSESGQFVEYAKVIKELDPETQIDVLEKVIEREQRRGNEKYEDVKLNKDLVEKYKKAKTDEERDAIMEEIKDDTARQIKVTFVDKANEFRFLSMLGNLKTHGRNLFGNAGMYSLQSFKDGVAAIGEDIYDKTSKNGLETRSKTLKPATKEVSKYVSDTVDLFMKDQKSKYIESRGMKGDLEGRTIKFNNNNIIGKTLNKFSDWNSKALNYEDRFFSSKMTKQAMRGFLTANGIETNADIEAHPELVAQALDYALFKGKEATFHQDSTTATAIRNFRDKLYTGSGFSKVGGLAVDATLPFVSTPANIAKNALEYTPIIGFGNISKQFQQAPKNMKANVFIDSLSKQFTGAALMAVGAYLASKGLVKGSGDDDKEDKTEASLGNASYSVKIGNSTYDLSWLSPTAIPFFEGVEVFNAFKKAKSKSGIKATDTADLIDTMFGTLNPMTDMSVLQSIERVITSIAYGGNAVKSATSTTFSSYLQQYIPTLLSQIAQVGDSKQRNTNTGGNVLEKTYDQLKYKIPGARNTLPEKVDVWGNANKTASNIPQRMFEAFLSPANRKDYKVDKTTKELERLARETDDTAMLPTIKNKSLTVNGKDYDLKGKDYVNLQKTYGKTAKKNLDKLIKSEAYKNADDVEKQSMVRKIYDYSSYKAKEKYAKDKGINFDSGNQTSFAMIDAFGISYEKYVENKVSGNDGASKMLNKLNGAGLSEAQKGAVMNYFNRAYYVDEDDLYDTLENSNLSNKQKELIIEKYEKYITDAERERYQRADNIGIDYDTYTNFRSFVSNTRGENRTGGLTKEQKIINYIDSLPITVREKENLWQDYKNNQGILPYYK